MAESCAALNFDFVCACLCVPMHPLHPVLLCGGTGHGLHFWKREGGEEGEVEKEECVGKEGRDSCIMCMYSSVGTIQRNASTGHG